MLSTIYLYSIGLLSTLVSVSFALQYGSAFANCIALANVPSADSVVLVQSALTSDAAVCSQTCTGYQYSYAYFTTSASTSTNSQLTAGQPACICSRTQPAGAWVTRTISSGDDTTCFTSTDYQAYKLKTTQQFQYCIDYADDVQPIATGFVQSYEACLTQCASYPYLFLQARPSTNQYFCICQSGVTGAHYSACGVVDGSRTYLVYYHDPAAQASLATKRKLRERLLNQRNKQIADCPEGLTACNVVGSPDSFECIDTRSELESCGGCLDGIYGYPSSVNATGTDCSSLSGVAFGAATCNHGRCETFACQSGYSLIDGQCVLV